MGKTGVGIIGASADRGWALDAHIPALAASPDFNLVAVATSSATSAARAAARFGVAGYHNPQQLLEDSAVELVVVSVRIPDHKPLVEAAIAAGKPVLCEWSLGAGLDETLHLAALAERAGVRGWVGLQARSAPGFRHVRALLDAGFVGEVLSSSVVASGMSWGAVCVPGTDYVLDPRSHAGLLVIPFGHTMEGICFCLGEADRISAVLATRRTESIEIGTGRVIPIQVPDQVATVMTLESGAVLSAHFRGGQCAGLDFHWEINGTAGDIVVTGPAGLTEMYELTVSGAKSGEPLAVLPTPSDCLWAPEGSGAPSDFSYNVAQAYALLALDMRDGGCRVPTFADAVRRSRMIAAIETAAETGQAQRYQH